MIYNNYLKELSQFNINSVKLGLGPISRLLSRLENPHLSYPSVLIGGTNGKGSIAAFTSSILICGGYRVGLYTSPHLIDVRERIRILNEMITPEEMSAYVEEVKGQMDETVTYFEFVTAVALLYFARQKIDFAVLEVGMGGRLDATNVVLPEVSVISNVDMDHMEYLGKTLRAIAREEGGIIKQDKVCLTGARQKSVLAVLEEICREKGASLRRLGQEIKIKRHRDGTFSYYGRNKIYKRLNISLTGRHQEDNAALALGALEELAPRGFPVEENNVRQGLTTARWDGRLERIQDRPIVLLDGAHNLAGVKAFVRAIKDNYSNRKIILVFGVMNDKKYHAMIRRLAPMAEGFIITKPNSNRAVSPIDLSSTAAKLCRQVILEEDPALAIKKALLLAEPDDLVCITGSLYLIGEAKTIFARLSRQNDA